MADDVVVTTGLTRRYGDRLAVDHLDLSVHRGEVFGFLGPNGAGKTTTLRMLVGLVRPTEGRARVLGRPPGSPRALRDVGALIEGPGFYPYLSGRDNLRVLARYGRLDDAAVDAALSRAELTLRGGDRFGSYSLGLKQRLGVAAALLGDPALLLLDEPGNGLDPASMAHLRHLISAEADRGHTVLLSSHLLGEVESICDRVGVIARGRLIAESTVEALTGQAGLLVRAEPVTAAAEVAARLLGPTHVAVADGTLRMTGLQEPTATGAELVRALVTAGIAVSEVRPLSRTLEDVYLQITGAPGKPLAEGGGS